MTNEELKKKIVEILDNNIRWQPYYYISRGIVYEDDLKNIADSLIAAGYGGVKEAEHRAARAERALKDVCINIIKDEEDDLAVEPRARVLYNAYLKQAEKELAEEWK